MNESLGVVRVTCPLWKTEITYWDSLEPNSPEEMKLGYIGGSRGLKWPLEKHLVDKGWNLPLTLIGYNCSSLYINITRYLPVLIFWRDVIRALFFYWHQLWKGDVPGVCGEGLSCRIHDRLLDNTCWGSLPTYELEGEDIGCYVGEECMERVCMCVGGCGCSVTMKECCTSGSGEHTSWDYPLLLYLNPEFRM